MNNQGRINTSGTAMVTGVNTIGLIALLAYSVRNINEVNESIDSLKEDLQKLQNSYVDNLKRTNNLLNKLNMKIDNNYQRIPNTRDHSAVEISNQKIVDVTDEYINEPVMAHMTRPRPQLFDDVTAAIGEMMSK